MVHLAMGGGPLHCFPYKHEQSRVEKRPAGCRCCELYVQLLSFFFFNFSAWRGNLGELTQELTQFPFRYTRFYHQRTLLLAAVLTQV